MTVYVKGMDGDTQLQNRRQRRSQVLMAAALEMSGASHPVKLRNLSADGALVEGDALPVEGAEVVFRRQELGVQARVIWVSDNRAGLQFKESLSPETVLRHIPTPRPRVLPEFRRPGLYPRPLTDSDRRKTADWAWRPGRDLVGE